MKEILICCISLIFSLLSFAQTKLVVEGTYQGKSLYVQNPFAPSGKGFCTLEVKVNGITTKDSINSSAYQIDLTVFGFKIGDPVKVEILHRDSCSPKILHPEHTYPDPAFKIISIEVDATENLVWNTTKEADKTPFIIEHFRWNKWVKIGEMEGQGPGGLNQYTFQLIPHSGENIFRVKKMSSIGIPNISQPVKYKSGKKAITIPTVDAKDKIFFSDETMYEIYDNGGNILKKGFGKEIDIAFLKKGVYFINYDNTSAEFIKK
jgi:hypothetical protein